MTGLPAELDAAIRTLTGVAYVAQVSDRHPLTGADAGRHRVFLRLALTATADTPPARLAPAGQGGALIDLDTARATRRPATRKENPGA
ncbi:hypothetical protein [Micromonospora sp. RTGN7]|uniref:hypothetical protein n=1 Tax=Micromonospora sp. RTGN7 TaxID=3016526 RepID=UPI0029FED7F4|nr:hypothetical protein [Micromonospora sp. RTGN7]